MFAQQKLSWIAGVIAGALAAAPATAEPLTLVAKVGQQQIEIEVGPINGEVRVYGIEGIKSGQLFTGITSIDLTTGGEQDYVEFRVLSDIVPGIVVTTGTDNSDVKFLYATSAKAGVVESTVVLNGADRNDKVNFLVESLSAGFVGNWTVNASTGENEITATVLSLEPSDLVQINLTGNCGDQKDVLNVAMVTDSAASGLSLGGDLAGGEDSVSTFIEQLGPGLINAAYALGLGSDKDTADLTIVGRGGLTTIGGTVAGGDGDDTLKSSSESDGAITLVLDGGAGADNLDLFAKGVIEGSPTLLGGDNDDLLKLVIDGPMGAASLADGGEGFDFFTGFAATIINCESIN